jgi:hypothetical protein
MLRPTFSGGLSLLTRGRTNNAAGSNKTASSREGRQKGGAEFMVQTGTGEWEGHAPSCAETRVLLTRAAARLLLLAASLQSLECDSHT